MAKCWALRLKITRDFLINLDILVDVEPLFNFSGMK
jgi:hypothetical protein